ncbi:hypothetical protein C8A01DRAFT_17447 [Parachaetomium inaequale]|uniref:Uncharacterized protein n=1 Tax=Parachaetomium inaequale TaxID=2588326 RepID=A0AAN6PEI1_9PEZI|nr:hypothetical protein C8A01DRAFT_17447 [Parachaetomium inaequale]
MHRVALQRALLAPTLRQPRMFEKPLALALGVRSISSVSDTSFWKSLVPKPLRSRSRTGLKNKPKVHKGWNPATFFIFIFLLIGSMSIQMIALRKDFATFMRQSDVRIGLLREVVEKLQRGEEVDVEKALGTGDAEKELEWAKVLREIEREEPAKSQRKKQPEPTPTPSSEAEAVPSPGETRVPMQSTLASKGFF